VDVWIRRMDRILLIYNATDNVILLTASSKLTKQARQDTTSRMDPPSNRDGLKTELVKVFERRVPFYKVMQKIEARKWDPGKETLD